MQENYSDASKIEALEKEIQNLKSQNQSLFLENKRYRVVARETYNSVIMFNSDYEIEWGNGAFRKLYACSFLKFKKVYGTNLFSVIKEHNIKDIINTCIDLKQTAAYNTEIIDFNGSVKWVHRNITILFIPNTDQIDKIIIVDFDQTSYKLVEDTLKSQKKELEKQRNLALEQNKIIENSKIEIEKAFKSNSVQSIKVHRLLMQLNEQNEELERARNYAEKASHDKSDFLAKVSHEIRTPMNGVVGMAQLMLHSQLTEQQKDYIQTIQSSADSLLTIINDILDVSKIESGKLELDLHESDCIQVLKMLKKTLDFKFVEKGIGFEIIIEEHVPQYVVVDALRLRQVLINLINNSLKFTEKGKVSLMLWVSSRAEDACVLHFEVVDTGIGIPKDKLKTIFENFSQVDETITRKYGGTGLGLTISKQLLQMMGGELMVESTFGVGSTFFFEIPVKIVSDVRTKELQEQEEKMSKAARITFKPGLRFLVAEDNLVNQKYIKNLLALLQIDAMLVENGLKAVEAIQEFEFDCVLMDMHMPVMTGIEATKAIRALNHPQSNIQIIALTAAAYAKDKEEFMSAGASAFLSKPITEKDLLTALLGINEKVKQYAVYSEEPIIDMQEHEVTVVSEAVSEVIDESTSFIVYEDFQENFGAFSAGILNEIIDEFIEKVDGKLASIKNRIIAKEIRKVMLESHSLKGEIAMFAAYDVVKSMYIIEDKARREVSDNLEQDFEQAFQLVQKFKKELVTYKK